MPWVTRRPRSRLQRLWRRWKRWNYDHRAALLPARIGMFIVGSALLLAVIARLVRI